MKEAAIIVGWICVTVTAFFLRFEDLSGRPLHADEGTGARIAAQRMESGAGTFDPTHYHGPLLADLAIPVCRMHGETGWRTMTKGSLRTVPAVAGVLLVFLPLFWRRRCGDAAVLLAAALLATSPLLVYYSRMFIHEPLLVLFGIAALVSLTTCPRRGIPGVLIGLMFAAKETFAISMIAWTGAALVLVFENRAVIGRAAIVSAWRDWRGALIVSCAAAALVACAFYTHGFTHPRGAVDAVRTFFVYETVGGHDKPIAYYLALLGMPVKSGGVWWFGTPVLVLAGIAFASTFRRGSAAWKRRNLIRFTAYSAAAHFLVYSLISYKTPWLACLPWVHVCVLAGFSIIGFAERGLSVRSALVALTIISAGTQFVQSRHAIGRLSSDERNPFAYVPTRRDVEDVETWLEKLRQVSPPRELDEVAVIGADYWPLPWYLRSFGKTGYWAEPPADLGKFPLVFAMPEAEEAVEARLAESHVSLPRGLRAGVPLRLFVANGVWQRWMETDTR